VWKDSLLLVTCLVNAVIVEVESSGKADRETCPVCRLTGQVKFIGEKGKCVIRGNPAQCIGQYVHIGGVWPWEMRSSGLLGLLLCSPGVSEYKEPHLVRSALDVGWRHHPSAVFIQKVDIEFKRTALPFGIPESPYKIGHYTK
jgi:hypothetical protein